MFNDEEKQKSKFDRSSEARDANKGKLKNSLQHYSSKEFPELLQVACNSLSPHPIDAVRIPLIQLLNNAHNYIGAPITSFHINRDLRSQYPTQTAKCLILAVAIAVAQDQIKRKQLLENPQFLKELSEWLGLDKFDIALQHEDGKIILNNGSAKEKIYTLPTEDQSITNDDLEDIMKDLADATKEMNDLLVKHEKEMNQFETICLEALSGIGNDIPEIKEFSKLAETSPKAKIFLNNVNKEVTKEVMAHSKTKEEHLANLEKHLKTLPNEIKENIGVQQAFTEELLNNAILAKKIDSIREYSERSEQKAESVDFSNRLPNVSTFLKVNGMKDKSGQSLGVTMSSKASELSITRSKLEAKHSAEMKDPRERIEKFKSVINEKLEKQSTEEKDQKLG